MIYEWLTEGLEHPIGDAAGEGVEDGVGRVDCDPVLDARQGHALLQAATINGSRFESFTVLQPLVQAFNSSLKVT